MLREIKPKNARSARAVKKREPQAAENPKLVLFLKSTSSSSLNNALMTDLHALKRPLAIRFTKKNAIHPFEDAASLEFFSEKNDVSLLCFSSHSKKRPHTLTFVRTFDSRVLDMLECMVDAETSRTINQFGGPKARVGTKPLIGFSGTQFEDDGDSSSKFRLAKSMFLDFFRGEEVSDVDVEGLQLMITFAAAEQEIAGGGNRQTVHMRVWRIVTKRSGQNLPRVELEEMGPRIDFRLGRSNEANESMLKEALKRSKQQEPKIRKNIETDIMGDKIGRVHLGRQNLDVLQTRKMKGLKRGRESADREGDAVEREEEEEEEEDDNGNGNDTISFIDEDALSDSEGGVDINMASISVGPGEKEAKRPRLE